MASNDQQYGTCPEHGEIAAEVSYAARPYPNCPLCGRRLEDVEEGDDD